MEKLYKQSGYKRTAELEDICLHHTDRDTLLWGLDDYFQRWQYRRVE